MWHCGLSVSHARSMPRNAPYVDFMAAARLDHSLDVDVEQHASLLAALCLSVARGYRILASPTIPAGANPEASKSSNQSQNVFFGVRHHWDS